MKFTLFLNDFFSVFCCQDKRAGAVYKLKQRYRMTVHLFEYFHCSKRNWCIAVWRPLNGVPYTIYSAIYIRL